MSSPKRITPTQTQAIDFGSTTGIAPPPPPAGPAMQSMPQGAVAAATRPSQVPPAGPLDVAAQRRFLATFVGHYEGTAKYAGGEAKFKATAEPYKAGISVEFSAEADGKEVFAESAIFEIMDDGAASYWHIDHQSHVHGHVGALVGNTFVLPFARPRIGLTETLTIRLADGTVSYDGEAKVNGSTVAFLRGSATKS